MTDDSSSSVTGSLIATGIGLGIVHVLTGPDHLSALATLSAVSDLCTSFFLGVRWGIGHSTGLLLVGTILIIHDYHHDNNNSNNNNNNGGDDESSNNNNNSTKTVDVPDWLVALEDEVTEARSRMTHVSSSDRLARRIGQATLSWREFVEQLSDEEADAEEDEEE